VATTRGSWRAVRSAILLFIATLLAIALAGQLAPPVRAECDGPHPAFERTVATARRLVIGEVVAVRPGGRWEVDDFGVSSRFNVRVDVVLRGGSPPVLEIDDVMTQPCAAPLVARRGDRVLLALDGSDFVPPMPANMIAWIGGEPVRDAGFETRLSLQEAFALVGRPVPEPNAPESGPDGGAALLAVGAAAAVGTAIGVRRRRGRSPGPR
jgi:hypothetical protein